MALWTSQQMDGVPVSREPEYRCGDELGIDAEAFLPLLTREEPRGRNLPKG